MRTTRLVSALALAAAAASWGACGDTVEPLTAFLDDSTLTVDAATSAGDAVALAVESMQANESAASAPNSDAAPEHAALFNTAPTNSVNADRSRTCWDANGAVVSGCTPISSVRKILTHVTFSGTRSGSRSTTGGGTASWTGVVHRTSNDTLFRNYNAAQPPVETSRTHIDVMLVHDTTTYTDAQLTRKVAEDAVDSVKSLTWNLPRSSNPYPVSGSIVRVTSMSVALSKGDRSESRSVTRTVEIVFPADAQGNVVLKVNAKTCSLNLVTHVVSDCK